MILLEMLFAPLQTVLELVMAPNYRNHILTLQSLLETVHVELIQIRDRIDHKDHHFILTMPFQVEVHIEHDLPDL